MQLGNITDLFANVSLAWLSSLCLFWSMALVMVGNSRNSPSVVWFGWTFTLTAFYFGTISLSTGVMAGYVRADLIGLARLILFADMAIKTILTGWFVIRRKHRDEFIELDT